MAEIKPNFRTEKVTKEDFVRACGGREPENSGNSLPDTPSFRDVMVVLVVIVMIAGCFAFVIVPLILGG